MTKLSQNDIKFLCYHTKLSPEKLLLLTEEERDLDLVLDSISAAGLKNKVILRDLSKRIRVKLVFFNLSKGQNCDISQKSMISNILFDNYDEIYCGKASKIKKINKNIQQLIGVIKGKNMNNSKEISIIGDNFIKAGNREIGYHVAEWVSIIKQTKELNLL